MSGGYFSYDEYHITKLVEKLEELSKDEENTKLKSMSAFVKNALETSYIYLHALDYYLSGDTSEQQMYNNIEIKLNELNNDTK